MTAHKSQPALATQAPPPINARDLLLVIGRGRSASLLMFVDGVAPKRTVTLAVWELAKNGKWQLERSRGLRVRRDELAAVAQALADGRGRIEAEDATPATRGSS